MIYWMAPWHQTDTMFDQDSAAAVLATLHSQQQDLEIDVLTYLPQLRYQLHDLDAKHAPYWSVWDDIQNVPFSSGLPLDYTALNWPPEAFPFFYSNAIYIYVADKPFALVSISPQGYVSAVHYLDLKTGSTIQTDWYDDRGFLSSRQWFKAQQQTKRIWFDPFGAAVLHQQGDHSKIKVAASQQSRFDQTEYNDLSDVVIEFVRKHFAAVLTDSDRILWVPTDSTQTICQAFVSQKHSYYLILSAYNNMPFNQTTITSLMGQLDLVLTVSELVQEQLTQICEANSNTPMIQVMPAFTTTLNLGISNELAKTVIYWQVRDLATQWLQPVVAALTQRIRLDDQVQVTVTVLNETMQAQLQTAFEAALVDDKGQGELNQIISIAQQYQALVATGAVDDALSRQVKQLQTLPNWTTALEIVAQLGQIQIVIANSDTGSYFHEARLAISVNKTASSLFSTQAISAGVPVLTQWHNDYLLDGQNGVWLKADTDLEQGIRYYLDSLPHWNEALVTNRRLIDSYGQTAAFQHWKRVLQID